MNDKSAGRNRLEPLRGTKRNLYMYTGNRCAFDEHCLELLILEDGTLNAEIAHIHGVKSSAARGTHDLTDEQLRSESNLLLLCLKHHKVVDNKALEDEYPVERMQRMKEKHEARFRKGVEALDELADSTASEVITYPQNTLAIGDPENEDALNEQLNEAIEFVDRIAQLPRSHREVLVHIAARGEVRARGGRRGKIVSADVQDCLDSATWPRHEFDVRIGSLKSKGFIEIDEDEDGPRFELQSSSEYFAEPDHFAELKELAESRDEIRDALVGLDFTIFDE